MTARRLSLVPALLLLAATLPAAAADGKDWRRIRIASEGAHPPFNYLDGMNQLQGFEIDLAREVCRRLDATCEFMTQDFVGLIPALIANRYDVAFSSLTASPARKRIVAFSERYYDARGMFVTGRAKPIASVDPKTSRGLLIGAKRGSVSERYLKAVYEPEGAQLKLYVTIDEARLDLAEGRIDAILGDKTAMLYWLETSPMAQCCVVAGEDVTDPDYYGEGVGAAVRKSDPELKAMIDRALEEIRGDGAYDAIRKKYFSFDPY